MQRSQAILITIACITLGTGCLTRSSLVPGADQVRVTKNPGDVANCKPVGNIHLTDAPDGNEFRNQVVGLGGNAAIVTDGALPNVLWSGVAYRCP